MTAFAIEYQVRATTRSERVALAISSSPSSVWTQSDEVVAIVPRGRVACGSCRCAW